MCKRWLCVVLSATCAAAAAYATGEPQSGGKLKITDSRIGVGHKAAVGDLVTVLYEGKLRNNKSFDSNFDKNANPFVFRLGRGEVIPGWDKGVVGMAKSGERSLVIPPGLGYGDQAHGDIPAGSTLYFTIRVLDIVPKGEETVFDPTDIKVGNGKVARRGSTVTVDYVGRLVNGKSFDSTYDTKKPVTFTIGGGEVLKAIEVGIVGMREGGTRRLRLPPAIAFGAIGNMARGIPRNMVVIYTIQLRKVAKAKR